jgi:hypothetical protein
LQLKNIKLILHKKLFMRLNLLFLLSITLCLFFSCKKEHPKPPESKKTIEGLWIGSYTVDGDPQQAPSYFSFIIKPEGKLVVESHPQGVQHFATGTWILNADTLRCTYVYLTTQQGYKVEQTATAIYNRPDDRLTSGTWKNIGAPGGTGKFTMKEIQ